MKLKKKKFQATCGFLKFLANAAKPNANVGIVRVHIAYHYKRMCIRRLAYPNGKAEMATVHSSSILCSVHKQTQRHKYLLCARSPSRNAVKYLLLLMLSAFQQSSQLFI